MKEESIRNGTDDSLKAASALSLQIRTELEMQMACNLREFKEFIDNEMIVILGQMDSPTQIFDHVFLVNDLSHTSGKRRLLRLHVPLLFGFTELCPQRVQ